MSTREADARRRVSAVVGIISTYTPDELSQAIRAAEQNRLGKDEAERFMYFGLHLLWREFTSTDYKIFQEQLNGYDNPALKLFCAYIAQGSTVLSKSEVAVHLAALPTE